MKRETKRKVLFIVLIVLLFGSSLNTQAASSKWKKACKAYRSYLAQNESHFQVRMDWHYTNNESYKKTSSFMIMDMDKNGVPELIAYHINGYKKANIYVYTYKNGKVKRVVNAAKQSTFSSSYEKYTIFASYYTGGSASSYGCSRRHLHLYLGNGAGYSEYVYTMEGGKLKMYAEEQFNSLEGYHRYKINGKYVSAAKYNSNKKKCVQKKNFVGNNASNRKAYIK